MSKWIKHSCLVILGLLGLKSTAANAAVDMALCIDGVAGDVQANKNDAGCIDVLAWSWGASNAGTVMSPGKVILQDITITKFQDNTSTFLLLSVAHGKHLPEFQLRVRASCEVPDCTGPITAQYTVPSGSIVTGVSTGGSQGEDRLTENVSFNLAGLEWCYAEVDLTGAPKEPPVLLCGEASIVIP